MFGSEAGSVINIVHINDSIKLETFLRKLTLKIFLYKFIQETNALKK